MLLGVLAAPSLLLSRRPDAKHYLDKIAPYQGWIGAISSLWGIWTVLRALLNPSLLSHAPIFWLTYLASGLVLLGLGLLLGVGILKQFVKAPAAQQKLDGVIEKLAPRQGQLGLAAIALGAWAIVASLLWRV